MCIDVLPETRLPIRVRAVNRRILGLIICCLAVAGNVRAAAAQQSSTDYGAFLNQYCITCHNQRAKPANLTLATMDLSAISREAETWEKVVRKLRSGMMPPQGSPRPDDSARS